jgi:predicted nucleic acid-binding protein
VILADTNILSTFAKVNQWPLLIQCFASDRVGTVPAVYEEVQRGVQKGYTRLQAVVDLVQRRQIELVIPTEQELFKKGTLAASFGEGEREIMAVAMTRDYAILTDETLVKNWCRRTGTTCWDLPGVLRALWRTNLLPKDEVRKLLEQIEASDRIVFKNKEQILQD